MATVAVLGAVAVPVGTLVGTLVGSAVVVVVVVGAVAVVSVGAALGGGEVVPLWLALEEPDVSTTTPSGFR
jgi:hypothetical protein